MQYRRLGRTGLKISALGLGTMQWGWTVDETAAFAVMDAFTERGGNFFDTANFYSRWLPGNKGGESESMIGHWLHARRKRSDIVLATKVYQPMGDEPNNRGLSRKHILDAVDASLRRLQTDYIDLYLAHAFDADTPIDETLTAFNDLVRMGKVRYVGASNYPAWRLMESLWSADAHHTARYDVLEPHYNLVHRAEFERDLKTICEQYQIGVIPYSSLAGGFLTGKYKRGTEGKGARAASISQKYNFDAAWRTVDTVQRIAQECDTTPAVVSLAWLLSQPVITAPIIGANTAEQLEPNFAAIDLTLTPAQIEALNQVSSWE
ncbi:NADP-dependent aryl-alcohol dehydrogenase [Dictyobacter vulcani]|uniref:NADP-dependent aryl-alcohol dehydrogenase n=1 Tax=Dictyobacter vulcani TaxID=2607529 RepID=A0A5J4KPE9_9CHLR|nr:aldo/keto reductase [Dictyobacter vulcani]GER87046.1 NADP-dependent aryl-alcohol dehydrogenase [Dictyobacter vulcani]